jgi:hypothetical protein
MYYKVASVSLSTSSVSSSPKEEFILWLFFTIVLAVLPLLLNYLILMMFASWNVWLSNCLNLLKDGELFFFSTTLSATSLNKLTALLSVAAVGSGASRPISTSWVQVGLWSVLIVSTSVFGLCTFSKLDKQLQLQSGKGTASVSEPNVWAIALGSILCAITSGLLSYVVYAYGGV